MISNDHQLMMMEAGWILCHRGCKAGSFSPGVNLIKSQNCLPGVAPADGPGMQP